MKLWYTTRELAGLPGLPKHHPKVQARAEREGWQSRPREGRGGGLEYHIDSLPQESRMALRARETVEGKAAATPVIEGKTDVPAVLHQAPEDLVVEPPPMRLTGEEKLTRYMALPALQKQHAQARFKVLELWGAHVISRPDLRERLATEDFLAKYNCGSLTVDADVRERVPELSYATLCRWRDREARLGLYGLANHFPKRSGTTLSAEIQKAVLGLIFIYPHIKARRVHEALRAQHQELAGAVGYDAVRRFMAAWKAEHPKTYLSVLDPDAYKSRYQPAYGNAAENIERLNQVWELDSTPADVMLKDGRHCIVGVIDVFSRRFKLLVTRTSKAAAVAGLFRRAVMAWGVPEAARTDNGKDYVSMHFTQALRALEVEHLLCMPFASEQKPFIERAFGTFSHGLLELLPGFIGHNVAERQAIEHRKSFAQRLMSAGDLIDVSMTSMELQAFCDTWCERVYAHNPHGGLGDRTPAEVAASWSGLARRITDERALDLLLEERAETRSVTKKGIELEGYHYGSGDLAAVENHRVLLRLDPTDLGRLHVFDESGERFIAVAECPELLGTSRSKLAGEARYASRAHNSQARAELRDASRDVVDVPFAIVAKRVAEAPEMHALPAHAEPYTTPQLDAAASAIEAADEKPKPVVVSQRARELTEALVREPDLRRAAKQTEQAERQERWDRYHRLQSAINLTESEAKWMEGYATTAEFHAMESRTRSTELTPAQQREFDRLMGRRAVG